MRFCIRVFHHRSLKQKWFYVLVRNKKMEDQEIIRNYIANEHQRVEMLYILVFRNVMTKMP